MLSEKPPPVEGFNGKFPRGKSHVQLLDVANALILEFAELKRDLATGLEATPLKFLILLLIQKLRWQGWVFSVPLPLSP